MPVSRVRRRTIAEKLGEAAAPTLERIRHDRERAPVRVKPLLEHIETHLFDPDLDGNGLRRACGIRDNGLPIEFHKALSLPPYGYIEDCRLEVACRLLIDTNLKVWQIAQQLGYSTLPVFSRAFERWSGMRPRIYRCRSRGDEPTAHKNILEPAGLLRAVRGELQKHEADQLSRHLATLYPDNFVRPVDDLPPSSSPSPPAISSATRR